MADDHTVSGSLDADPSDLAGAIVKRPGMYMGGPVTFDRASTYALGLELAVLVRGDESPLSEDDHQLLRDRSLPGSSGPCSRARTPNSRWRFGVLRQRDERQVKRIRVLLGHDRDQVPGHRIGLIPALCLSRIADFRHVKVPIGTFHLQVLHLVHMLRISTHDRSPILSWLQLSSALVPFLDIDPVIRLRQLSRPQPVLEPGHDLYL